MHDSKEGSFAANGISCFKRILDFTRTVFFWCAAMSEPTSALIVKEKWALKPLNGEKTWEIRGSSTSKRGKIAIAISGTGKLYGEISRLAKAAGAEPAGQMRDETLHAVVARSTCPSQNVQNTSAPDHFWKLRCRKSARRCGAKHISKSKCTKHLSVGPLLEVAMSKKCTPLWLEAHFQVKMYKTLQLRTTSQKC